MQKRWKRFLKGLVLFIVGGFAYAGVELLFRGYTFFSMFIVGGLCFLLIGLINEFILTVHMPLIEQMFIASILVTCLEYVSGVILNIWLNFGIWDYSNMPYNLHGQICLLFSVGWFFLSVVGIVLDDYTRHFLYKENRPDYSLF